MRLLLGLISIRLAEEDPIDILNIDNTVVRQKQIERIEKMKQTRDEEKVNST